MKTGAFLFLAALGLVRAGTASAERPAEPPLVLSTAPALVRGRLPAPNVFVAVHEGATSDLQPALRQAFGAERLPGGRIRLAWQASRHCEALPDAGPLCRGGNALKALDDARRLEFEAFTEGLRALAIEGDGVSPQSLVEQAQAYLQRPGLGVHSAGAAAPTERLEPVLGCRKSFMLLATTHAMKATSGGGAPADWQSLLLQPANIGDGKEASRAIRDALDTILAQSLTLPISTIGSLTATTQAAHDPAALLFAARYLASRWSGEVAARPLAGNAADRASSPWGQQAGSPLAHTSASLLDERDPQTRVIFSSKGGGAILRGIAFRWDQLALSQQEALNSDDVQGPQRLHYLRGDRAREQAQGGPFRDRDSRQADSVNSGLWYAASRAASGDSPARPAMLYLGGNGGMLHGFDADTGVEKFAYVPQGVYSRLGLLTRPQYVHQPYVDGSPFTAETIDGPRRRRTLLAGFLGAGGKGYFVLDVSDPAALAEDQAAQFVLLDSTADADPDLGHFFAEPVRERGAPTKTRQITRLNDGRWALVIGNGYNSDNQRAVLLVQYLDGAREMLKIPAGQTGGNGLSAPRLVDTDGDQVADLAYAGDLRGQLWRFDLGSRNAAEWKPAFDGRPLFTAQDADGQRQPISVTPVWLPHPQGGRMLVFGTGRLLTDVDRRDTSSQTLYGIRDQAEAGPLPAGRGALVQQAIDPAPVGAAAGRQLWTSSDHPVPGTGSETRRGWFLDLPVAGERVIAHPQWFEGKLIDLTSMVPPPADAGPDAPESCEPAAIRAFRNTLQALDGARPRSQLYGEEGNSFGASRIELHGEPSVPLKSHGQERAIRFDAKSAEGPPRRRLGFIAKRPSWRQLQ
ncbi:pilus assembly protein [Variovorax sp. LARHSF232]